MKAIVYTKYGPPEVAQLIEVAKPIHKDNEVLVKVYASTVNRTDSGFRSAEYFISRFWSGLLKPNYPILGCEFYGNEATLKQSSRLLLHATELEFKHPKTGKKVKQVCEPDF